MRGLKRPLGASWTQRTLGERLPRRRPRAAWLIAVIAPVLLTLCQRLVGSIDIPPAAVLFVTLLIVVLVALLGGVRPAVGAMAAGLLAQEVFFDVPYGSLTDHKPAQAAVLVAFVGIGGGIGLLVDELARLTTEQAALRRIATLVASGAPPRDLFSAVAEEVAALLVADSAYVGQLEPDGNVTIVAVWGRGRAAVSVGDRREVPSGTAAATVLQTARPARTDADGRSAPEATAFMKRAGMRSNVATPIVVDGRLWGVIGASSRATLSRASDSRMLRFTEVVATAIANAESRSELTASRARIVAASDEARRLVERDLHDGVQQRLVSLALEVRAAQSALPPELTEVQDELSEVVAGLSGALEDLREIARGIHPAILSEGGLAAALKTLARRSPVPVALDVRVDEELSDGVEVAAYYAVSELVANTAKHAQASMLDVTITSADGTLRILARDDGIGGADPARGSGLVGLRDRIEALGGTISIRSPRGEGTAIEVALAIADTGRAERSTTASVPGNR
jgi:signal transduction histidine kinase